MGVETDDDRALFLGVDEFGTAATYRPAGNLSRRSTINGIFDAAHLSVDVTSGIPVSSSNPIFTCRTIDLTSGGSEGDRLTIGGVDYLVRDVQSDGTGMTVLELEKA
jgi:hypothetical protein